MRLVLVEPNGSGGLIHYNYQLCTALAAQGADVTLITSKNYELAHLPHNFRIENILELWPLFDPGVSDSDGMGSWHRRLKKIRWTARRGQRAVRLVIAWIRLVRHVSRLRPDLVQFSKINFPFEALFLAQLRRQGLVLTQICHEFELRENHGFLSSMTPRLYGNIYRNFRALFFHANENRERFLKLYPFVDNGNTHIIPHGNSRWLMETIPQTKRREDLLAHYGLQESEAVVLFFGLLAPSKGLDDLLDAFAIARQSCRARLLIAGYPTKFFSLEELRSRILALELAQDVILDPRYIPLDELGALMSLATVVVYPYRSSTQSGALQVAYTFGRPVIAAAVGGLPESVDNEKSGFLVPARSPAELAKRIVALVSNPALAREMGAYARRLSETRFGWEAIARQILEVYEKLLRTDRSDLAC